MELRNMLVGDNLVQVACDGAHVAVNGPLVVIEDHDEAAGLVGNVVECFKRDAVGEGGVSGQGDDMLMAAGDVTRHSHAQCRRERRAGVPRSVGVVLALAAQHEAIQTAGLAQRIKAIGAARQQLVHIRLMADVKNEAVLRRVKHIVHCDSQLNHAEVGTDVAAGAGHALNETVANLLRESFELRHTEMLDVGRRVNRVEKITHAFLGDPGAN